MSRGGEDRYYQTCDDADRCPFYVSTKAQQQQRKSELTVALEQCEAAFVRVHVIVLSVLFLSVLPRAATATAHTGACTINPTL